MIWAERTAKDKQNAVRELVETQGLTYAKAAVLLGTTKLAVVGVVERSTRSPTGAIRSQHLPNQKGKSGFKRGPRRNPKPKHAGHTAYVALPPGQALAPDPGYQANDAAWAVLAGAAPVSLEVHRDGQCRFPHGDTGHWSYCGEPVEHGANYCRAHQRLTHRELPAARGAHASR